MGAGLFVNDLFNGEALGGPRSEGDRGVFRANLFDSQPLGQTTPETKTSGGKADAKTATPTPGEKSGASLTTGGAAPEALPYDSGAAEGGSEFPWLPVALVGGGLVLTVGAILLLTGKKSAPVTSNRRRRRRR